LALLILVGLFAGVLFGLSSRLSSKGTSVPVSKASSPIPTTRTKSTPTIHRPTPIPTAQPAPTPIATYPPLVVSYSGGISDQFTNPATDSSMALSSIQQRGSAISGYFSVGQGLIGSGNFNGSVTIDHKIQFLVPGDGSLAPLFFQGVVQQNGTLSGTYCSQQNGQCNQAIGGFGIWKITPSSGQRALNIPTSSSFASLRFSALLFERRRSEARDTLL
jgi:eukaryotic-like serine/threonine-protein kinase